MKCGNCNVNVGCSCNLRIATDGKRVCASCLAKYEQSLKQLKK